MNSIMPPGHERAARQKRLENELRQARAGELAGADEGQRARIEKEIRAELNRCLRKEFACHLPHGQVLW
jgi:hypothetical protein